MLDIDELIALEDALTVEFEEHLTEILTKLNRSGDLDAFLGLIGLRSLIAAEPEYEVYKNGKIVVIGQSSVDLNKIQLTAKKLGINPARLELHLEYEDGKNIDINKYQYDPNYSALMFGPIPHSGVSKGDYSSVITRAETEPGFPPVERIGTGGLKITKASFKDALQNLLNEKKIMTDN